jgi:hypothetical protein
VGAGWGFLLMRAEQAKQKLNTRLLQVNSAIKLQALARRRLDQHKVDELRQQKRVEDIIAEKEAEERSRQKNGASFLDLFAGGAAQGQTDAASTGNKVWLFPSFPHPPPFPPRARGSLSPRGRETGRRRSRALHSNG